MSYEDAPGFVRLEERRGETTLVVDAPQLVEAARFLREEEGFSFLSDVAAADYLGWGARGVSGYVGGPPGNLLAGRDLNEPMTQGYQALPEPKPKRFSVSYHLLAMPHGSKDDAAPEPRRARLQIWLDDGEPAPSVVSIWPTADWHEREAFDLMGIRFDGHPNLQRILMDEDWEGHPLRKDYPIGGEPVRFSGEE